MKMLHTIDSWYTSIMKDHWKHYDNGAYAPNKQMPHFVVFSTKLKVSVFKKESPFLPFARNSQLTYSKRPIPFLLIWGNKMFKTKLTNNYIAICKQLGLGWDVEWHGVSSMSMLFDTQTFLQTFSDIEALCKLKQMRNLADNNLFGRLRVKQWQSYLWPQEHSNLF